MLDLLNALAGSKYENLIYFVLGVIGATMANYFLVVKIVWEIRARQQMISDKVESLDVGQDDHAGRIANIEGRMGIAFHSRH